MRDRSVARPDLASSTVQGRPAGSAMRLLRSPIWFFSFRWPVGHLRLSTSSTDGDYNDNGSLTSRLDLPGDYGWPRWHIFEYAAVVP